MRGVIGISISASRDFFLLFFIKLHMYSFLTNSVSRNTVAFLKVFCSYFYAYFRFFFFFRSFLNSTKYNLTIGDSEIIDLLYFRFDISKKRKESILEHTTENMVELSKVLDETFDSVFLSSYTPLVPFFFKYKKYFYTSYYFNFFETEILDTFTFRNLSAALVDSAQIGVLVKNVAPLSINSGFFCIKYVTNLKYILNFFFYNYIFNVYLNEIRQSYTKKSFTSTSCVSMLTIFTNHNFFLQEYSYLYLTPARTVFYELNDLISIKHSNIETARLLNADEEVNMDQPDTSDDESSSSEQSDTEIVDFDLVCTQDYNDLTVSNNFTIAPTSISNTSNIQPFIYRKIYSKSEHTDYSQNTTNLGTVIDVNEDNEILDIDNSIELMHIINDLDFFFNLFTKNKQCFSFYNRAYLELFCFNKMIADITDFFYNKAIDGLHCFMGVQNADLLNSNFKPEIKLFMVINSLLSNYNYYSFSYFNNSELLNVAYFLDVDNSCLQHFLDNSSINYNLYFVPLQHNTTDFLTQGATHIDVNYIFLDAILDAFTCSDDECEDFYNTIVFNNVFYKPYYSLDNLNMLFNNDTYTKIEDTETDTNLDCTVLSDSSDIDSTDDLFIGFIDTINEFLDELESPHDSSSESEDTFKLENTVLKTEIIDDCENADEFSDVELSKSVLTPQDYLADIHTSYFDNFMDFFFTKFVLSNIILKKKVFSPQYVLNSLLFLPDLLFFFNSNALLIIESHVMCRYTNITPLFNSYLRIKFKKRKAFNLININIYLWYLLQYLENKLNRPLILKTIYLRRYFGKHNFLPIFNEWYLQFKHYNFKFKRFFFLNEIIKVMILSICSRDSTLFLNWVTWTLMHIPYKDVKGFLYFMKLLLKKHVLPLCNNLERINGFIFDIRGKVGVTGDAKKRHTLISWGQTSFSRKELKVSLKQGLVYTRTGVMGVTVIMFF